MRSQAAYRPSASGVDVSDHNIDRAKAEETGGAGQPGYLTAEEILSSVPIQFSLRNRPVRLQALSGEQFDTLIEDASDTAFDDRGFIARFIARQAVEPQLRSEDVASWSDQELLDALGQWLDQSKDEVEVEGELTFGSFRAWARKEAERIQSEMRQIYDRFQPSPALEEAMRTIKRLTPTIDAGLVSRLIEPIPRAQLEGLLGPSRQLEDFIRNAGAANIKRGPTQPSSKPSTSRSRSTVPPLSPVAELADLQAAKREADRAREIRAIEQTEAAKELVKISKGQSTALQAMVAELQGLRHDQATSSHWAKWAAIAAGVGAFVAAVGIAVTIWLGLGGSDSRLATPAPSVIGSITASPSE